MINWKEAVRGIFHVLLTVQSYPTDSLYPPRLDLCLARSHLRGHVDKYVFFPAFLHLTQRYPSNACPLLRWRQREDASSLTKSSTRDVSFSFLSSVNNYLKVVVTSLDWLGINQEFLYLENLFKVWSESNIFFSSLVCPGLGPLHRRPLALL